MSPLWRRYQCDLDVGMLKSQRHGVQFIATAMAQYNVLYRDSSPVMICCEVNTSILN